MKTACIGLVAVMLSAAPSMAQVPTSTAPLALRPDQKKLFEVYKEVVETDTTLSSGSCTKAAEQIATRLRAAGYADKDVTVFSTPEHPKEGGVVAVLEGSAPKRKAILLLAHLDVVEAKRADWVRDPFKLVEEGGYYYARGSLDDKSMVAIWADLMIRLRQDRVRPKRTVKMALTCGEQTVGAFNGAAWLAANRPDLIAAELALNEGGGGDTDGKGKLVDQTIQAGEKTLQNFRIETTNPGGHSSTPVRDNAIYELADALVKVRAHEFPAVLSDVTRAFFAKTGASRNDALGKAMVVFAAHPEDKAAEAEVSRDRVYHSMMRTTCVATLLDGGHAMNALPQRAGANVNCRILPGESIESVRAALAAVIGDPKVSITRSGPARPPAPPVQLDPRVVGPAEKLSKKYYPGVPFVPAMLPGGTDAVFLGTIGIPTYGVPGGWGDPDNNGMHGLDERVEVRALYSERDYLDELVRVYANMK